MDTFVLLKILYALSAPPASLALGVVLTLLLLLVRWPRLAAAVLVLAIAHTLVLSFPPVGDALMGYVEGQARAAERRAPACCYDAIMVLGGAIRVAHPPERPFPELHDGSDRIWQAARLYRRGVAPRIIVTGGSYDAQQGGASSTSTEAQAMRIFLLELGVPSDAITEEGQALNTIQNIRNVRAIVGNGRVALVTSAFHMPRALQLAARGKLDAAAFPVDYQTGTAERSPWEDWLPSVGALIMSTKALKEIVALNLDVRRSGLDP
jgi:uncharacterized SAM-binding protein YcdF (DUF218 family)